MMAVERYIGGLDNIPAHFNPPIPQHRINDDNPIGFEVPGLVDGNADVIVYLNGLSTSAQLTKSQAHRLADLLTQATDI